ncbi:MAG: IscS subfamily cysteine desulfurase [Candidatus Diapherotrites archaeon]|nr:IscS subfamily cysteine desulfurase [Candidatus Diapherotrites archaeon]
MKHVYLDHAATTYVRSEVKRAMLPFLSQKFGNPGSFHSLGLEAKNALDASRKKIAKILDCNPEEIIFTGSGTESVNLAIKGVAFALRSKGKHIVTQKTEHHAVLHTCEWLEKEFGFEITYVDVDKHGIVKLDELEQAIRKDTILISTMYANNEIGTIQPVKEIAAIAKKHNVLFHTDACQAAGFSEIDTKKLGIDLMTVNGSKIYAMKGTGLLFVKKGTPLQPLIHGGAQENVLRAGTENVAGIVGLATALELAQKERKKESKRLSNLRQYLIKGIRESIPKTILLGHPVKRLPNNASVSFLDVEGEAILLRLNENGICVSSGSACTSHSLEPSHVVIATGMPYEVAHGSVRFSLGKRTTKKDIDFVLKKLPKIISDLRLISPVELGKKDVGL